MLLTTRSSFPYNLPSLHHAATRRRVQASSPGMSLERHKNQQFLGNLRLQIWRTSLEIHHARNTKIVVAVNSDIGPGPSLPADPSPGSWKLWILGMVVAVIVPFWRNKWMPLLLLKNKVDSVVDTAEHVAEFVEEVAEEVEKIADEVADHLSEGGKFQKAARIIENIAKETAEDAHMVDEVIDKAQEVEKELESLVEPFIHNHANQTKEEAKD